MITWNKRFKNIHAFETTAKSLDFKVKNGKLVIPQDIHLSYKIYSKNFYAKLDINRSFSPIVLFENVSSDIFWIYALLDEDFRVTLKKTYVDPFPNLFGSEFPVYPKPGKLFFNRALSRMFVWNGLNWIEHDAIVIGKFEADGSCSNLYSRQSQGGFKSGAFLAERPEIVKGFPVRVFESSGYSFLTREEAAKLAFSNISNVRLDTLLHRSVAQKNLPKFTAVIRYEDGTISNASIESIAEAVAVTVHNCEEGKECLILEKGHLYDRTKQWPFSHNSRLYYNQSGLVTTLAPPLNNSKAVQEIGHVVDIYTIYIDPREKIILGPP